MNRGHNKVVRIPPGESVVLNSAERAPYLLLVEVLVGELDFSPSTRANKEVLKRLVLDEGKPIEKRSNAFGPVSINGVTTTSGRPVSGEPLAGASIVDNPDLSEDGNDTRSHSDRVPPSINFNAQEEEVDLVEQLYGADLSVRSQPPDLSDSIVLPPTPKNKAHDIAAWAKTSPGMSPSLSPANIPMRGSVDVPDLPQSASLRTNTPSPLSQGSVTRQPVMSLEDYSERMRTAAIMLAQLNANLVREPITTIAAPPGVPEPHDPPPSPASISWTSGALSWIPGSGRIMNGHARTDSDGTSVPAMRMKLQPAEAAAIREKIMQEMMALEEERVERMKETDNDVTVGIGQPHMSAKNAEDEGIVRRELNKVDPSGMCAKFFHFPLFIGCIMVLCV